MAVCAAGAFADAATAKPAWRFDFKQLEGVETILGGATGAQFTLAGLTTKCEGFLYIMKIKNAAGTAEGEVTYLPIFDCTTNSACTVEASEAVGLPSQVSASTVGVDNYVIVEGVRINFIYGDPECVFYETEVELEGSLGGLFDNETESMTFDASSTSASGTELQAFGIEVEFKAVLGAEAFGPRLGEALTL